MSNWLLLQQGLIVYLAVFALLIAGGVGLPVPEDLPLILGGVMIETGRADPLLLLIVCYLGVLVGDGLIFVVGRRFGPGLFQKRWFKNRFSSSRIRRIRYSLERKSLLMILVARHLFYLRTVTFLICGAVRMNPIRFFVADAVAALISVPVMIAIGFLASAHIDAALETLSRTKTLILLGSCAIGLAMLYLRWRKKRAECLAVEIAASSASNTLPPEDSEAVN